MNIAVVALSEAENDIRAIRNAVFCEEQRVPTELEWDGKDPDCTHVIARDNDGHPIGTGRLQRDGRIGRLAVRKEWRGQGVGRALLMSLIETAIHAGIADLHLHSQVDAVPFYEKQGFTRSGDVFIEADIEHVTMTRRTAHSPD